ncbi:MAG: hypothetical protein AAF567_19075 [Actinomycetota bacterium]
MSATDMSRDPESGRPAPISLLESSGPSCKEAQAPVALKEPHPVFLAIVQHVEEGHQFGCYQPLDLTDDVFRLLPCLFENLSYPHIWAETTKEVMRRVSGHSGRGQRREQRLELGN